MTQCTLIKSKPVATAYLGYVCRGQLEDRTEYTREDLIREWEQTQFPTESGGKKGLTSEQVEELYVAVRQIFSPTVEESVNVEYSLENMLWNCVEVLSGKSVEEMIEEMEPWMAQYWNGTLIDDPLSGWDSEEWGVVFNCFYDQWTFSAVLKEDLRREEGGITN